MWEINLDFLSGSITIIGVSEISCSTAKVVSSIHIIDRFDFLFKKIWIVSKEVADVDRETN